MNFKKIHLFIFKTKNFFRLRKLLRKQGGCAGHGVAAHVEMMGLIHVDKTWTKMLCGQKKTEFF